MMQRGMIYGNPVDDLAVVPADLWNESPESIVLCPSAPAYSVVCRQIRSSTAAESLKLKHWRFNGLEKAENGTPAL